MTVFRPLFLVVLLCSSAVAKPDEDAALLAPVFEDAETRPVLKYVKDGDWVKVRDALLALSRPGFSHPHLARLRFLLGLACVRTQDWQGAVLVLDALEDAAPLVLDRICYLRGLALARLDRFDEAVLSLSKVPKDSAVYKDAAMALAEALTAAGRVPEAADAWLAALATRPLDPRTTLATFDALLAAGRQEEAKSLLRKAYFDSPGPGRKAYRAALERIGAPPDNPTPEEALRHARALLDAQANQEAAEEAARLATLPSARCEALTIRAVALGKLRRHKEATSVFKEVISRCEGQVDMAKTLFNAARSAWRAGERASGDAWAERLAREHKDSSLNDDLAVMQARAAMLRNDSASAVKILQDSLARWPLGDMANEARWVLAWTAYRARDYKTAIARLREGATAASGDAAIGSRFCYWLGRTYWALGQTEEAQSEWQRCVKAYPMTYYAQLSAQRLAMVKKAKVADVLAKASDRKPAPFLKVPSIILKDGPLARAIWLVQTGLKDLAGEELAKVSDKNPEAGWVAALILDAAGSYTRSHRLAASLLAQNRFWPDDSTRGYWRLAYPRPWSDLVASASKESGVDKALIFAVMREESAFVPSIESRANAIGLMQLILPTAKAMGAKLKMDVTPDSLRNPDVNIRLGAAYLSELLSNLKEPIYAIPGYNAGLGAIRKWLKAHPGVPADEFVEEIGAEETRDYARKVFESYAAYRLLWGEGAHVKMALPPLERPKAEKKPGGRKRSRPK